MLRFALTIFLSAFLLFQVQPMIGKYILPWFGGTTAVWTTCMLFFQVLLLAGYAYAHGISSARWRNQGKVHLVMLAATIAFIVTTIAPSDAWKPSGDEEPTARILLLLLASIGLPYLVLSATGPLLQNWFRAEYPSKSPYRLYALSNVGSLLALVTYPIVFEAHTTLFQQVAGWSIAFGVFIALCGWCALRLIKDDTARHELGAVEAHEPVAAMEGMPAPVDGADPFDHESNAGNIVDANAAPRPSGSGPGAQTGDEYARHERGGEHVIAQGGKPGVMRIVFWLLLAASASAMLLATTNQLTQEVASRPFLWILPLALYLLTFIISFEGGDTVEAIAGRLPGNNAMSRGLAEFIRALPLRYSRWSYGPLLLLSVPLVIVALYQGVSTDLWVQIVVYALTMFACCMGCHGELVDSKPDPKYLTLFYLTISAGGALGGAAVAVGAPQVFDGYFEYQIALAACVCMTLIGYARHVFLPVSQWRLGVAYAVFTLTLIVAAVLTILFVVNPDGGPAMIVQINDADPEGPVIKTALWNEPRAYWQKTQGYLADPGLSWLDIKAETSDSFLYKHGMYPFIWIGIAVCVIGWSIDAVLRTFKLPAIVAWLGVAGLMVLLSHQLSEHVEHVRGETVAATTGEFGIVHRERNFYGVLKIERERNYVGFDEMVPSYDLMHGRIRHGFQFLHPEMRTWPTSYYGRESGVGMAIELHPNQFHPDPAQQAMKIGVIGLGTGTVAAYGEKGDTVRYYEINPDVVDVAEEWFTYLQDARDRGAKVDVVLGDARIQLERELENDDAQKFDVLAVDAFSSDAIPIHLLTREAVAVYFRHLKPDGLLALHISNRFVKLEPICLALAEAFDCQAIQIYNRSDNDAGTLSSTWVILTHNRDWSLDPDIVDATTDWTKQEKQNKVLWTDDFASLWEVLRWN